MSEIDRKTIVETGISNSSNGGPGLWVCKITSGESQGREAIIGARPVRLGADSKCDIVISDPTVSRQHAEIRATAEGIVVQDLGSTNGTFYRSSRIESAVVQSGATIRLGSTSLKVTTRPLQTVRASGRDRFGGLIGPSLAMREVFAILELASPTDVTALIEGESGTGKELVARALHDHSQRATKPFVVVDCTAAHDQSIESHLFGHQAGAFTGALKDRSGAFQEAAGGTIFLDEISELSLASQAKLLRVLEARTVQPLGSDRPVRVDVRIVVATNRDLSKMVEEKTFRFDLFHRLAVVHVNMPPLRERLEDIPALTRHFYEGRNVDPGDIEGQNLKILQEYDWPGNVRELRNALERAWVFSGIAEPKFKDLQIQLHGSAASPQEEAVDISVPFKEAKEKWLSRFEQRYVATVFAEYNFNISQAAEHAGINRNHFRKLLEKHNLKKP